MTIIDFELSVESIPLKTPFVTSLRRVENVEFVRLKLLCEDGLYGVGEAPPTKAITGEDIATITAAITEKIVPQLLNRPLHSMEEAQSLLHESCIGNSSAKAAVDIALYDLFAKRAEKPLYGYLGGTVRPLRTDVTISLDTSKKMAEDAYLALQEGFDILKVKVGGRDAKDIERIHAVREAAPTATILLDANQAWDTAEALSIIEAVHELDISLVEQPLPANEIEAMQRIATDSPIPILADESAFDLKDAKRVITSQAADMINIKLMKCGGIHKALEIIRLCEEKGVKCMMGSMLEGPTSIAAAAHLSLAYPDTVTFLDLDSPLLYKHLPEDSPVNFERNVLTLSEVSGITG